MNDEDLDGRLRRVPETSTEVTCLDDGELLSYQRGLLSPERAAELEGHLAHCRPCRQLLLGLARPISAEAQARAEATFDRPRVVPLRRIAAGLGLALAAGVAMFTLSNPARPLPDYELEGPLGGIAAERGAGAQSAEFALDGTIRLVLRPSRSAGEGVQLGVFRVEADGRLVDITGSDWSVNADGGARWASPVRQALGAEPGRFRLAIVISTQSAKRWNGVELEAARGSERGARWWTTEVTVVGGPKGSE